VTTIEEFSSEYYLIDAETVPYPGREVISPHEMYAGLCRYVSEPMIKVGGEHRWLAPEGAVPADTLAIPEYLYREEEPVLVAKDSKKIEETIH
jgi:hypothetical protein